MGFWGGTFLFILLEAGMAAAVVFRSKPHTVGLNQVLCGTTVLCCWMMWAIIYIAQTHPLIRPVLQA